jgi:hypothetical protein
VLGQPNGVAVDGSGNLYFSDNMANEVEEWNAGTQMVTPLASGLNYPSAVAVDGSGNVYFSDTGKPSHQGMERGDRAGDPVVSSGLSSPDGVAVDGADNVYFADAGAFTLSEIPNAIRFASRASRHGAAHGDLRAVERPELGDHRTYHERCRQLLVYSQPIHHGPRGARLRAGAADHGNAKRTDRPEH